MHLKRPKDKFVVVNNSKELLGLTEHEMAPDYGTPPEKEERVYDDVITHTAKVIRVPLIEKNRKSRVQDGYDQCLKKGPKSFTY